MQTERLSNGRNVRSLRKFNEARWQQRCNFGSCNGRETLQWKRTAIRQNIAVTAYHDDNAVGRMHLSNMEKLFETLRGSAWIEFTAGINYNIFSLV